MLRFDAAERRRRLAVRHALAPGCQADGPAAAARRVVALHGTDPASVFLAAGVRTGWQAKPADIEDALYEQRRLVRMLGMRRTVFVMPADLVPLVLASTMTRIADVERARLLRHLAEYGVAADSAPGAAGPDPAERSPAAWTADPGAWLADVERSVLQVLAGRGGSAAAAELSAAEPRLKTVLRLAEGKRYAATATITSRVLLLLGAQGHIVRGRPAGSWLSQQYRWWLAGQWLPAEARPAELPGPAAARAEVARRWLTAFGPAPLGDLQWWTGWTRTEARAAAAAAGAVPGDLDTGPGLVLGDDAGLTPEPGPWVALLPALDPTVMGWSDRSWFLHPHGPTLFDRNGNAGPTVWAGGRIVGGWAQRPDGEIAVRLLEDVGTDTARLIELEAARMADWLGAVRVIPRFRTPAERELSE